MSYTSLVEESTSSTVRPSKYGKKFAHSDFCVGDRFLPRRSGFTERIDIGYYCRGSPDNITGNKSQDIFSQDTREYVKEEYRRQLQKLLCLPAPTDRILFLGNNRTWHPEVKQHWPVKPRKQPLITTPDCALDLPEFRPLYYFNVLDWGATGYLSAALNTSFFLWHPSDSKVINMKDFDELNGAQFGTAVKWDNTGEHLATGTNRSHIQYWNIPTMTKLGETWCHCALVGGCSIDCLAWHPTNGRFVSGCSQGVLMLMVLPNIQNVSRIMLRAHNGHVISLRTSPDGRYLVSAGDDKCIRLWLWPNLEPHFEIIKSFSLRAVAWHPWQPSLLAVGGGSSLGSISVWNVSTHSLVSSYTPKTESVVLSLEWSSLTGELVASYWVSGSDVFSGHSEVLVLSSLTRVVDKLLSGTSFRVMYLMWSPDGKQLATASSDEILRIWSFMGPNIKKQKRNGKSNKINLHKSLLDSEDVHNVNTLFLSKYAIR